MNLKHSLLAIAMSTVFAGPALAADAARQAVVDALASNLVVKYERREHIAYNVDVVLTFDRTFEFH